ncbi:NHLP bacteriocin export ABC transporter permease/ATPase subunit [Leptothermofonsia sichuanensis E412]|uniref:NHLP bacteriocin export ABC transporter permease/ATPase subunit n=1 Tax=Leptothermofonsia sichuanensis TaxID=2917832 RepID=UPI001CA68740|nr:NHLP bacteriocin export ABC transporter permease/ATPase subunit [Leptothermofonsia sichuanensis]QZZ21563.1 NHLP bacteriocin export ABC transporter permease/ATPase subunit [Leptothermofonsia sichuanensis E412]
MLYQDVDTTVRVVKGNAPLHLNMPDTVWLVQTGSMAVFAVATIDGVSEGARRYLFEVNSGDVLYGIAPNPTGESYELLAVAYEDAQVTGTSLPDWIQEKPGVSPPLLEYLPQLTQQWVDRLLSAFEETAVTLDRLDVVTSGDRGLMVEQLHQFHRQCLHSLHQLGQQEKESRTEQFQERMRLNWQVSERAIGDLTAIFRPKGGEFFQEGTDLLMAAGAVGRALGIEIKPPARSEDLKRVKDPLDAIARASRIRTRRIILAGTWWKSDCGPLLAYTADGERPVALLPVGTNRYEIFDPELRRRTPVDRRTAQQLSPVAYMFYRPLPDVVKRSVDVLRFAVHGRMRDLVLMLVLGITASLLGMVVPQATGILIDKAIPDAQRLLLFQIGLGLLAVSFGKAAFEVGQNIAMSRFQTHTNAKTQAAVWDRLLKLRVSFFRQYSIGDLQSRVSAISQIRQVLGNTVMRTIFTSLFALLNLGLLFYYNWQLALVAVGIALVNILVTNFSSAITRRQMRPLEEIKGEIFGLTVQLIGGVSKLRVSASEDRAFAYWSRQFSQELKLMLSTEAVESAVNLFNMMLPTITSLLIYILAVHLITTAQEKGELGLSLGTFLAFNASLGTFVQGATDLSNAVIDVLEVSVLWERAKPILDEVPEVDNSKTDPGRLLGGVRFDRVSFRYQPDGPLTLDKISIEAKPGEFIALVGPSGSGKSTTLRLLLGFEQPEEGTIYFDGQDQAGLDITAVRRQLGVVLQNGRISSASIFENISGGALVTMDEAWEAARMAGFAEDIQQMPMGMHTVISEGGTNLSGGQRQRLLIARSLVLKPKILIFDEATSALDNRTQAIVTESLDRLRVTRIVIAHRLSTIRNADRIYVIANGQVVQQGAFEQLMQQQGLFADLMSRQIA